MSQFWKDIRQSLRTLMKRPAFLAVALLTLALGIGANTALFSVVNAALLRQLPFAHADRTFWITALRPDRNDAPFSLPDFLDYRDHTDSLDSLSAIGNWSANVTGRGNAERLNGVRVSANLFETLGVNAAVGRTLEPEDDRPEAPRVAVMTYGLWQRRFGGDTSLVGQPLELNGASYTLVGILPPSFFFPIPEAELAVPLRIVNPMYLKAMRISLLAGREFNESDTDRTPLVCHINETLAKRFWPKGDAVGAHVMLDDNDSKPRDAEVVGIIHDVKDRGLEAAPSFDIYIPFRQTHEDAVVQLQNNQYWVLRTDGDPLALANAFRGQVRSVDGDVAASNVRSMDQYLSLTIAPRRFNLQLLSVFALAALALAVAGIYGVISYSVNQRAHEIGVRMAMGAQRSHVLRTVIADGIRPVLAGLALGILSVLGLSKALASLVYAVSASDPATLAGVTLIFGCVSLAALYLPARRATRIDPLVVLR